MVTPLIDEIATKTLRLRYADSAERFLSARKILDLWTSDAEFSGAFSQTLADMRYEAFFWEMPPLTVAAIDHPFECVIVDAPSLARVPTDARPFARQLAAADAMVATFPNLGGDAVLIVPRDPGHGMQIAHLASFLRTAPADVVRELWRAVALAADTWLKRDDPFWISTSGLGVAWLHVRIDGYPKYYTHKPYRNPAFGSAVG